MAENIYVVNFKVESEAYQALTDLKQTPINDCFAAPQAAIIVKQNGQPVVKDGYDTGADTSDDSLVGGLLGSVVGVVGGPIGVLLGGSYGFLVGSTVDAIDGLDNASLTEKVCEKIADDTTSLIALVDEAVAGSFEAFFKNYDTAIDCFDAAEIAAEIEAAEAIQAQMEKQARKEMREAKKAARKEKVEEKRAEIKAGFESFKAKFKKA